MLGVTYTNRAVLESDAGGKDKKKKKDKVLGAGN